MRLLTIAPVFLLVACSAPFVEPTATELDSSGPTTADGRPLTPYYGDYEPLGVVVEGEAGPPITTLPSRERAPDPVTVEVRRGGARIRPAAGQAVDIRHDSTVRHVPPPAAATVYVDAQGRPIHDAMPAGPNAYFDRQGNYRLTHDRGDGTQTAYPGQDRPSAREAYDRAARDLGDQ